MRILNAIFIILCAVFFIALGATLIAVSLNLFSLSDIGAILSEIAINSQGRLILAVSGILVALLSITLVQAFIGRIQREKTIAFNTSGGQVSISLSAIEDFVKRLSAQVSSVKDLRNNVIATKRGLRSTCGRCSGPKAIFRR